MTFDLFFDLRGRPPIEDDPQFGAWGDTIPRLWFNEQRRTMRINDDEIFGAAALSTFYFVTHTDTLAWSDSMAFGPSGYLYALTEAIDVMSDGAEVICSFVVQVNEMIPTTEDGGVLSAHSDAIVHPIVDDFP